MLNHYEASVHDLKDPTAHELFQYNISNNTQYQQLVMEIYTDQLDDASQLICKYL